MSQLSFFGEPEYKPEFQQWHTPPKLAERMATEFTWRSPTGIGQPVFGPSTVVLEPSAGGGALVRAALDQGVRGVVAVELDPEWIQRLHVRFEAEIAVGRVVVVDGDFLANETQSVVMDAMARFRGARRAALSNVPFDDGLDGKFMAAVLGLVEDHVALTNDNVLAGKTRYEQVWSRCHLRAVRHLVRRPVFSGAPGGGMKDMTVHWSGPEPVETSDRVIDWWPESWS